MQSFWIKITFMSPKSPYYKFVHWHSETKLVIIFYEKMIESFTFVERQQNLQNHRFNWTRMGVFMENSFNSQIQELCEKSSVDICKILQDCYNVVCQLQEFQEHSLKKALSVLAKEKGINMKLFMHILRVSLSGLQVNNIFTHLWIHVCIRA